MTSRRAAIGVSVLVLLSVLAGVGAVAAQESPEGWEPPGQFPIEDLRQGGAQDPDAPDSARMLGNPVRGSAAWRYTPVSPLKQSTQYLDSGQLLQSDRMEFYSTAFGDAAGEYTLVLVYWNEESKRVNGTQVTYAADQSVQRITLDVEEGYATQEVELRSHYDSKKQVTAWLERDGEEVEGARWRFQHRSNPLTASPGYPINSKSDIWRWAAINIFLPGVPGILIGRRAAGHVLDRTIVGPQKGGFWWAIVLAGLLLVALAVGTWQTAAVLSRAPYVAGLFVAMFSFAAFLGFRDQEVERAEFNQKDLETVTSVSGEDSKRARHEDIQLLDIIRRDGKIYTPAPGLRPFFARYWADPAHVDETDLKTVNNTSGDVSKKYELDPQADDPLVRTPARLAFEPALTTDEEPEPVFEPEDDTESLSTPHQVVNSIAGGLGTLNLGFLGPAILGGALVYFGVKAWLGVPSIAALAGIMPAVVTGYTAHDGSLDIVEAPYHFSEARAILADERAQYDEASTFEQLQKQVAKMDMDGHERVLDVLESHWQNSSKLLDDMLGVEDPTDGDETSRERPRRPQRSREAGDD
ncbi:hypothetical protein [Halobacterium litoreum]|uniref:DUF2207 domain-containing protein n=1 Tax=Halobacterium litoreum TaxID=2039234 RepID=A0ABD5NB14_9EURY|nr:hypothetical protein [Halobacterium litoreum]UHH14828.1 hypothetical protein LT972_07435 [Halobacterium litoreum]